MPVRQREDRIYPQDPHARALEEIVRLEHERSVVGAELALKNQQLVEQTELLAEQTAQLAAQKAQIESKDAR